MYVRLIVCAALAVTSSQLKADPIPVINVQGASHGFLLLRSETGAILAHGEYVQTAHGDRVTSRLTYRFRDGSLDDDLTVFTQRDTLRLVSDHHIQRGPSFPEPLDLLVEGSGQITTRSRDKDGKPTVETAHLDLPPDISNGIVGTILVNTPPGGQPFYLPYVANIGKGRLVRLKITPDGQAAFTVAGLRRTANIFRIRLDLGGIAGVAAPILGKQPDDSFVWVLPGDPPAFMREITPITDSGGPMISVEPAGTAFPTLQPANQLKPAAPAAPPAASSKAAK
jgi:hypothetical protein